MKPPLSNPIKNLEAEINPEIVIKNKESFIQMVSELENLVEFLHKKFFLIKKKNYRSQI